MVFGKNAHVSGAFLRIVALIVVVVTMLITEEAVVRLYRTLN